MKRFRFSSVVLFLGTFAVGTTEGRHDDGKKKDIALVLRGFLDGKDFFEKREGLATKLSAFLSETELSVDGIAPVKELSADDEGSSAAKEDSTELSSVEHNGASNETTKECGFVECDDDENEENDNELVLTDERRMRIVSLLNLLMVVCAVVFMFTVGLTLDEEQLKKIFVRSPTTTTESSAGSSSNRSCCPQTTKCCSCTIAHPARVGLFAQILFNPVVCVLLCLCFVDMDTRFKLAAVLISCSPSGLSSNFWVILSYGNTEVSVVMTLITSAAAIGTVPLFFWIANELLPFDDKNSGSNNNSIVPVREIFFSVLLIVVPLLVAVVLQRFLKNRTCGHYLQKIGMVFAFFTIVISISILVLDRYTVRAFANAGWQPFVLGVLLNGAAFALGYFSSIIMKLDVEYHRTIAYEVASQNLAIPFAVFSMANLNDPELQAPYRAMILCYAISSLSVNVITVLVFRYGYPLQHIIDQRKRNLETSNIDDAKASSNIESSTEAPGADDEGATSSTEGVINSEANASEGK